MSIEDERRRERAELEAEFARLDTVYEVLADMQDSAVAVVREKGFENVGFEESRLKGVSGFRELNAEREWVRDRLLDYQFSPERAAQIRSRIAELRREREAPQERPGRSR
ncbi:hypothetical protein [Nocardia noduli]|uniref:hypothetical protein n=1 Tax=Nocardia noduli TaxID=2815722 RepID=UPI001C21B1BC|nr:hypothetical protein [Nocardia noduli]